MIEIVFLADYPMTIPTMIRWFRIQWPEYYAQRTPADIAQDFHSEANHNGLPVRLLAFSNGELAGTITLRERAIRSAPEFYPGLGGLLVVKQHRGRGIGTELVRAGMRVANQQDYKRIYATTVVARGILERLGWALDRELLHEGELLLLYRYELAADR